MLQYANLHSFTFPITRTVPTNKLENLVISLKNDGTYKARILKYNLTLQEHQDLENGQLKTIQNPIETIIIDNFDINQIMVDFCTETTETIVVGCGHIGVDGDSFHGLNNIGDWINCKSSQKPRVYTITRVTCIADSYSGGGGGGDGSSSDTGGGGSDVDYPGDFPTADTNPEDYEEGISLPVTKDISDSDAPQTPCETLTKATNTTNYKTKFSALNQPAKFTAPQETGFALVPNTVGGHYNKDLLAIGGAALKPPSDGINFTHVHNNHVKLDSVSNTTYDSAVKILSPADIKTLTDDMLNNNTTNGTFAPSDTFAVMISDEGIFAVAPIANNITILKKDYDNFNDKYKKRALEIILIKRTTYNTAEKRKKALEKMMLQLINETPGYKGKLELFEGDATDPTNLKWTKKSLNPNNPETVDETPC